MRFTRLLGLGLLWAAAMFSPAMARALTWNWSNPLPHGNDVGLSDNWLRPVLMTSLAAALGMLPLACGVGTGAQMLRPLGIAVIGALFFSVCLSLIATPVVYYLLVQMTPGREQKENAPT
jgi:hypothetical protein